MPSAAGQQRARASVAIGFVTGLLSGMAARRISYGGLLAQAGIVADDLGDASARVPLRSYATLYNLAVHELQDEGFGLFSAPLRVGSFEFLCRSVLSSQ